jgi:hypothetical protein
MLRRRIKLRLRYYFRKLCRFLLTCPDCGSALNTTATGRQLCPHCGR